MKGRPAGYKLSPNEEARLIKEARETRRKQRLLQVRQQDKINAAKIRQAVKDERNKQIQKLAEQIKEDWTNEKEEKLKILEEQYSNNVNNVGQGHTNAVLQEPQEEKYALLAEVDRQRALIRHHQAIEKLHKDVARKQEEERKFIISRQNALKQEKERAAEIAARPPPPPDPINDIQAVQVRPIKFTDLDAFSTTHMHIPDVGHVEKAEKEKQVDARDLAKNEAERAEDLTQEQQRLKHEQREKARLRHKHALQKELLKNDYRDMLHDLSDLQRADMQHRQTVVAKIPKQIFLPPHRRLVEKEDTEREKEQAFEEMYMASTEFMGDLSLALDPHPPLETPTITESLDLSVLDPDAEINGTGDQTRITEASTRPSVLRDVTNTKQPIQSADTKTPDGLKRLLSRIKSQRNQWSEGSAASEPPGEGYIKQSAVSPQRVETSPSQHTLTSVTQTLASQSEAETLTTVTEGQSDLYTQPTDTTASQNTHTESAITATLSEGTLTPSSAVHMLLHPIEKAARVRQEKNLPSDLSGYLETERQKQLHMKQDTQQIQDETEAAKQLMLQQKLDLEKRLAEIEAQRANLTSQLSYRLSQLPEESIISAHVTDPKAPDLQNYSVSASVDPAYVKQTSSTAWPAKNDTSRDIYELSGDQHYFGNDSIPSRGLQSFLPEAGHIRPTLDQPAYLTTVTQPPLPYQDPIYPVADTLQQGAQSISEQYHQRRLQQHKNHFDELNQSRQEMLTRAQDLLTTTYPSHSESAAGKQRDVLTEAPPRVSATDYQRPVQQPERVGDPVSTQIRSAEPLPQVYLPTSAPLSHLTRGFSLGSRYSSVPGRPSYISDLGQFQDVDVSGSMGNLSANSRPSTDNTRGSSVLKNAAETPRFELLERRLKQSENSMAPHLQPGMNTLDFKQKLKLQFSGIPEHGEDLVSKPAQEVLDEDVRAIKEKWMQDFLQSKMSAPASVNMSKSLCTNTEPTGSVLHGTSGALQPVTNISDEITSSKQTEHTTQDSGPQTIDKNQRKDLVSEPQQLANMHLEDHEALQGHVGPELSFHPQTNGIIVENQKENDELPAVGKTAATGNNNVPVSRSWHKQLLKYSVSSNSNTGESQQEEPLVDTEPEPLQFEVIGPNSPPILRRNPANARQTDTSGRLASTPLKKSSRISNSTANSPPGSKPKSKALADLSMKSVGSEDLSQHTLGDHTSWMRTMATEDEQGQLPDTQPAQYSPSSHFRSSNDFQELKMSELSSQMADPEGPESGSQNDPERHRQSQRSVSSELSQYPLSAEPSWTQKHRYSGYSDELSQHSLGQSGHSFLPQDHVLQASDLRKSLSSSTQLEQFPLENESLDAGASSGPNARVSWNELKSSGSGVLSRISEKAEGSQQMDDTISRQVEECLARHQELMAQTQQLIELPADVLARSGPTPHQSFHALKEDHRLSIASQAGTGISEEPEITLVSLGSSCDSDSENSPDVNVHTTDEKTAMAMEQQKDGDLSVLSFEHHEQSIGGTPVTSLGKPSSDSVQAELQPQCLWSGNEPSPVAETFTDRYLTDRSSGGSTSFQTLQAENVSGEEPEFRAIDVQQIEDVSDDIQGLTLQDAFMRKKKSFIKASQKRKDDVEEKAKNVAPHHHPALEKTLSSWKRSRGLNAGSGAGPKTHKVPDPTDIVERSSAERIKSEQEMKTRTSRLYNQLDEVKEQKKIDDRKKFYAKNREKAKEYQKNYQEQLKKKMGKKK